MNADHYNPELLSEARRGKVTQRQLAKTLNVTEITIYRAETGQGVSFELLSRICQEVGIDIKTILKPTFNENFLPAN